MSAARMVYPPQRLLEILQKPGGLSVAEALERAERNLDLIRPKCLADLAALLEVCEGIAAGVGGAFSEATRAELYVVAVRGIGAGAVSGRPGVDEALGSFCDLLENFRISERWDREAIAVHVQAWRLLMGIESIDAVAAVLAGLRKVSAQYAAASAAPAA